MPLTSLEDYHYPIVAVSPLMHVEPVSEPNDPDLPNCVKVSNDLKKKDELCLDNMCQEERLKVQQILDEIQLENVAQVAWSDILEEDKISDTKKEKALQAKLEIPLLTLKSEAPSPNKKVSFAESLEQAVPKISSSGTEIMDISQLLDDEHLGPLAILAQEKVDAIVEADLLVDPKLVEKLQVPKLPKAKSKIIPPISVDTLLESIRSDVDPMDLEFERQLNWVPFSSDPAEVALMETMTPCPALDALLAPPEGTVRSQDLLWKREGLRICDVDDEILGMLEPDTGPTDATLHRQVKQYRKPKRTIDPSRATVKSSINTPSFSASSQLMAFINTRDDASRFGECGPAMQPDSINDSIHTPTTMPDTSDGKYLKDKLEPRRSNQNKTCTLPLPGLTSPRLIVVDPAFLQHERALMRSISEKSRGLVQFVHRDLLSSLSAQPAPDVILSPITALVFTTLQATTQRALPGQSHGPTDSPIKNKILHLAAQYDTIFIVMTISTPSSLSLLDPASCAMLNTFTAFCTSLGALASVQIIICSSESTGLSRLDATCALVFNHAFDFNCYGLDDEALNKCITSEDSAQEAFLRTAGLNAFAAMVLAIGFGMRSLVQASSDDRVARLDNLIGPRVVARLNAVLEMDWSMPTCA